MKIVNHDIESCGPEWLSLSRLYSSRALGITEPGDLIQLPSVLLSQWPAIQAHYERIGLDFTREVIWDLRLERILEHPSYQPSLFFFGDKENRLFPDNARYQITRLLNSKNDLITLAVEMGIPVPQTRCFDRVADAAGSLEEINFPCYVKPSISLSGLGISRCENSSELQLALGKLPADIPVQIQKEVNAEHFLSVQYSIQNDCMERLLVSEQILDGSAHSGNRFPTHCAPWAVFDKLAEYIQRQGMKGIFAFDVAVVNKDDSALFCVLECNPRFTGATYPTLIARKIGATHWSTATLPTSQRELHEIDLSGIEYDPAKREGVILVNWGTILHGSLMVMLVGTEARQDAQLKEFKQRVSANKKTNMPPVLLTPKQMARVTAGQWKNLPDEELSITGVNFYLPWVKSGDLFIHRSQDQTLLSGEDALLDKAFQQGAAAALVLKNTKQANHRPLLEVENIPKAFQDLALASSLAFDGTKVMVTGSHGKTGFKTQLFHVLRKQIETHAHLDSANLQNPVWRTLTAIPKGAIVAIIETAVPAATMGEDRSFFIRPNYCVITGIGLEHLSSHKTVNNLILNKAAIVTGLRPGGKCILNADDPSFSEVYNAVRSYSDCEILSFGSATECAGRLVGAQYHDFNWQVVADILGETVHYTLPLIEDYAPLASVGVLLLAKLLGANLQASASEYLTYKNFESSGNLYEVKLQEGHFHVYDQSRRGEWKGFESMFELMSRLTPETGGRKIAILSELINLDDNPDAPIDLERMRLLFARAGVDILFSIHRFKEHSSIVPPSTEWLRHGNTFPEIQDDLFSAIRPNDMIFVRGIEDAHLDKLVNKLIAVGKSARKLY
ncbi:MAG: Mur ligase family protein [Candidatus Nitrotoga sp.]|nr:Mur ligase family protein [Candidatus Nitrotoga sp.]